MGQGTAYTLTGPSTVLKQWLVAQDGVQQRKAFTNFDLAVAYIREQSKPALRATNVRIAPVYPDRTESEFVVRVVAADGGASSRQFTELAEATWFARCALLGERYTPAEWKKY